MKGKTVLGLIILIVVMGVGWISSGYVKKWYDTQMKIIEENSSEKRYFEGKHELKAIGKITESQQSKASGGFFFIFGSYSQEGKSVSTVSFAWKFDNEYIISTVPLDKIRIKIDESVDKPYILFRYYVHGTNCYYGSDVRKLIEEKVIYIVIVCKESMWNPAIQMPLSEGE